MKDDGMQQLYARTVDNVFDVDATKPRYLQSLSPQLLVLTKPSVTQVILARNATTNSITQSLFASHAIATTSRMLDLSVMVRLGFRKLQVYTLIVVSGNSRVGQEIAEHLTYRWTSNRDSPKMVEVRWALPGNECHVELPILKLSCLEYVPGLHKDTQTIQWQVNDKAYSVTLPPFAVPDEDSLHRDIGNFLSQSEARIEQYIRQSHVDEVSRRTFKEACRYRDTHSSDLVRLALRIRCGSVMCQGFGTLIGNETLGIKPINFYNQSGKCLYDKFNACSDCPVPEAVDHQIDVEMLGWLRQFQLELSGKINKILFPPGKRVKRLPWYELFLTCFIMISNLEFIHGGALAYMESQRKTVSALRTRYGLISVSTPTDQLNSNVKMKSTLSSRTWSPNSNTPLTVCSPIFAWFSSDSSPSKLRAEISPSL
jgi:hypothetical protein